MENVKECQHSFSKIFAFFAGKHSGELCNFPLQGKLLLPKRITMIKFDCTVKKSKIDGKGVFARTVIPKRRKIGELEGTVITIAKANRIAKLNKRIAIVELDETYALNATDAEGKMKYINHSCIPNTYMRVIRHRVEFWSRREIHLNEELTCNYGETHHEGTLKCNCGVKGCKGYL
jgi:uncharacterized protein